jgi:hypothetical protein
MIKLEELLSKYEFTMSKELEKGKASGRQLCDRID